jgi:CBS domain containing-hemolysin-like protein
MPESNSESPGGGASARPAGSAPDSPIRRSLRWVQHRLGLNRNGHGSVREQLEELIEERGEKVDSLDDDERILVSNILRLHELAAEDVMIPRADIVAVNIEASLNEVIDAITRSGHSRLPLYRDALDDAVGMIHIKDVVAWRGPPETFRPHNLVRPVLFVAPSMEVLRLLLEMLAKRSHMALVVDEFGGVDGLITIEDLVEEIVGEIADEHSRRTVPNVLRRPDGSLEADARVPVEELDHHFGAVLGEDEREEVDTIGGLVAALAGRVPARGETITHPSGLSFEVLDAAPRRIKRLRVYPPPTAEAGAPGGA